MKKLNQTSNQVQLKNYSWIFVRDTRFFRCMFTQTKMPACEVREEDIEEDGETKAEICARLRERLNSAIQLIDQQESAHADIRLFQMLDKESRGMQKALDEIRLFQNRRTMPHTWKGSRYTMFVQSNTSNLPSSTPITPSLNPGLPAPSPSQPELIQALEPIVRQQCF